MPAKSGIRFEIPLQAYDELQDVAEYADSLDAIQEAASQEGALWDSPATAEAVSKKVSIGQDRVVRVLRGLLSLRTLMRVTKLTASDLFDTVTASIKVGAQPDWRDAHLEAWQQARERVVAALMQKDDALSIESKTRELTFLHEKVLRNCRLLMDLRPVYDDSAGKIANTILTVSLFVRYVSHGRERETQFAMDLDDLAELRRQCERVERKLATAERMFADAKWPLKIPGKVDKETP